MQNWKHEYKGRNMNFADTYYKKTIIQKLFGPDELLTVFCAGTNMPLVQCSDDTGNDRVFVLEKEELLKDFCLPYAEKKLAVRGIKYPAKEKMKFFAAAASMSIDEIIYVDAAGSHILLLSDVIKKKDLSSLPKEKRPVENPALLLSGVYFMQEASRNVPPQEKKGLAELEEELSANIVKGTFIIPAQLDQEMPQGQQPVKVPLLKTPAGDTFQPVFTDNLEFAKYNREGQFKALAVPFPALEKILAKEAKGFMLNPGGFHIVIAREMLKNLAIRFGR